MSSEKTSSTSQPPPIPAGGRGVKSVLRSLVTRAMRPALAGLNRRLDRIESQLAIQQREANKYEGELEYWRRFVKRGGAEKDHGEPYEVLFSRWQRHRLLKLAAFLGVPGDESATGIDRWCALRSVIEIGAGPYPAVCAAKLGWKRSVAVDPIGRRYVEEDLVPKAAERVVYIDAPGERIPLPAGFADLVIIENCLDHVTDPVLVIQEIFRLLRPGGLMWLFVDLSDHRDALHPHPMTVDGLRKILSEFKVVREEVSTLKAHPKAHGGYRALVRKPGESDVPSLIVPAAAVIPATPGATDATPNGVQIEAKVGSNGVVVRTSGQTVT